MLVLVVLGAVLSGVLLYHDTAVLYGYQRGPSFCTLSNVIDCDRVARSPFSRFFGVPVSGIGLVFYLTFLGVLGFLKPGRDLPETRVSEIRFALAFAALIPTLLLATISVAVLQVVCLLCAGLYVVNIAVCGICARSRVVPGSLWMSFFRGCADLLRFARLAAAGRGREATVARMGVVAVVATGAFVLSLPSVLTVQIFSPREARTQREMTIAQAVDDWTKTERVGIAVSPKDFRMGASEAPVQVVVFSDMQCPFCKAAARALEQLSHRYEMTLVFKNFPLDKSCNRGLEKSVHFFACSAALYARCAGEQGASNFWRMHDAIADIDHLSPELLASLPKQLGLDETQIESCISAGAERQVVLDDVEEGLSLGIQGTPAIYVNGKLIATPVPEVIERVIGIASGQSANQ